MTVRISSRERKATHDWRTIDAALRRACTYPHPAGRIRRIETHISVVYLAGRRAYKINKPVTLGFADFTGLTTRQQCCENEVRLNQRLAKSLYAGVLPLMRVGRTARLGGNRRIIGYAVLMRRFEDGCLFSDLVSTNRLRDGAIERAAERIAAFHQSIPALPPRREYGSAPLFQTQVNAALDELEGAGVGVPSAIRAWCDSELGRLADDINERRRQGFVRECHGDLHLDNLVQTGRGVLVFDCIAFSESLQWIDVMNDVAFLVMDLQAHGRPDVAARFLNRWLFLTGDFSGLRVLRLYVVYRALVRTLVETLKARGDNSAQRARRYLDCAFEAIQPRHPLLLLCHGFSGSGKSVASAELAPLIGAVRISSDTERKRNRSFQPAEGKTLPRTAYARAVIDAHYDRLRTLACQVIEDGYSVIVDATFLKNDHRRRFFELADALSVPVLILDFHASTTSLFRRISERRVDPHRLTDADEQVLVKQLANEDPLVQEECVRTLFFDTDVPQAAFCERTYWKSLLSFLNSPVTLQTVQPVQPTASAREASHATLTCINRVSTAPA
jgi:aminoglycoside phosphotransferase family enzyme/predicted kinase